MQKQFTPLITLITPRQLVDPHHLLVTLFAVQKLRDGVLMLVLTNLALGLLAVYVGQLDLLLYFRVLADTAVLRLN